MSRFTATILVVLGVAAYLFFGDHTESTLRGSYSATVDHIRYVNELIVYQKSVAAEQNYHGADAGMNRPSPPAPRKKSPEALKSQLKALETKLKSKKTMVYQKRLEACQSMLKVVSCEEKLTAFAQKGEVANFNRQVDVTNKAITKLHKQMDSI